MGSLFHNFGDNLFTPPSRWEEAKLLIRSLVSWDPLHIHNHFCFLHTPHTLLLHPILDLLFLSWWSIWDFGGSGKLVTLRCNSCNNIICHCYNLQRIRCNSYNLFYATILLQHVIVVTILLHRIGCNCYNVFAEGCNNENIARGTTDPGYCIFNLSYLSS